MRRTIMSLAMLLATAGAFAQDTAGEDIGAAMNEKFEQCWANTDPKACGTLYTEDATSVDPAGQAVTGRQAIEAAMAQTFEMFGKSSIKLEQMSFRRVTDNVAVSDGTWEVTGGPEGMPAKGFYSMFLTQVNGEWLVASDQAKIPPPMPE